MRLNPKRLLKFEISKGIEMVRANWRGPKGRGKPRKRGWDLGAPVSPTLKGWATEKGWTTENRWATEKGFRTVTEVPGSIHKVATRREPPGGSMTQPLKGWAKFIAPL